MSINNPDNFGFWGEFGGRYVPETLMGALDELEESYSSIGHSEEFKKELEALQKNYIGRPTPLFLARQLSTKAGKAKIYLKREDLAHTGAHKINNTIGQILLAKKMGKKRIIAETGAGQHGVATATACALMDLECLVYMGSRDIQRQNINVKRMQLLGATVIPVTSGTATLKDAINEAIRDWITYIENTFYCIGSVVGPHPYPLMVREFQSVIGKEARTQILELEGQLPHELIACVGGGSNAMGLFHAFLDDKVKITGVEAGGSGPRPGCHSASLTLGRPGVLHGTRTFLLQDDDGQIMPADSISAGLDYPGVGPEHASLFRNNRVAYTTINDSEALAAFQLLTRTEGIIPALESAHAVAHALKISKKCRQEDIFLVNLSGRGDKDLDIVEVPE